MARHAQPRARERRLGAVGRRAVVAAEARDRRVPHGADVGVLAHACGEGVAGTEHVAAHHHRDRGRGARK